MFSFLQKNPRILLLIVGLILVSGSVAFTQLPRMEDPRLTPRAARIITVLPGADAERIDSLVTEKLESELREVEEIKTLRSFSSTNVSYIGIELADEVNESEAENTWTRVRDKASDALVKMPEGTLPPEFKRYDITASAMIVALKWDLEVAPNYAIMHRLSKELKDEIDSIPGTEKTQIFGEPEEEILVSIDPEMMTSMQLRPRDISRAIKASDSKISAGLLRSPTGNTLLEVAGELDTLKRIGQIPVQVGDASNFVELENVASIEKTIKTPMDSKVIIRSQDAIAIGVQIQPRVRLDMWMNDANRTIAEFEKRLPNGISLNRVFEQDRYVSSRMDELGRNLVYGIIAIFVVVLIMMGWRSALVVGLTLPLVSLMVLACMHFLGIPIHQMSVTGLIISLGLMIDNAIVVVDEIGQRLRAGASRRDVVQSVLSFLAIPLLGSTATTALSFSPIILMGGPAGEFVGAIAIVAAVSVFCSLLLCFLVIGPLSGLWLNATSENSFVAHGFSSTILASIYRKTIGFFLNHPVVGMAVGISIPVFGFAALGSLPEQFFPPSERSQFQMEIELPAASSIAETERYARLIREHLLTDGRVEDVHWFIGSSAPVFYYNVVPDRFNLPYYGQAIVDCKPGTKMTDTVKELQMALQAKFPKPTLLLQLLEQGPPFDAPIEVRIKGPDKRKLRELGDQIRLILMESKDVYHTRSGFAEPAPKISFTVDEQQARLAGLDFQQIADGLNTSLEGVTGGSIVETTEELPVRVRVSGRDRENLSNIASLDLLTPVVGSVAAKSGAYASYEGVPLGAISEMNLVAETVTITQHNGERVNEVQAYLDPGVLPAEVMSEFRQRLANSDLRIPPEYEISYGGAEEKRNDAVGSLVGNLFIVLALISATLIISLGSFRLAMLLFGVAILSVGFAVSGLWLAGYPWGFMSMVAIMGMIGVAVNDSIVVLANIRELPESRIRSLSAIQERVSASTRHVLSTSLTTIIGFTPLFLFGGDFWSPVAVAISAGVLGATVLALLLVPCAYVLLFRCKNETVRP